MKCIYKKACILFLTAICLLTTIPISIYATGDANIDNGGGGMQGGTSENFWNSGYDGVRITVVDADTGTKRGSTIDYTNKSISSGIYHFGNINKLDYRNGKELSIKTSNYIHINPIEKIPVIVSNGYDLFPDIEQIRSYFTDEQVIRGVADDTGMNYTILTNGSCKLLIEPIAYFTYNGIFYAMTATEAALYNQQVGGNLCNNMAPLTHKNLPLAMYLEKSEFGFNAWTGSKTARATDSDIINYLGIGAVSFKEETPPELEVETADYIYRVDTDVITAITVSGGEATPDEPVTVVFKIMGTNYTVGNIVYPENSSQLVWVKWHTPSTPQTVNISVEVSGVGAASTGFIKAKIESLDENPPPDPTAYDKKPSSFSATDPPNKPTRSSASWSVWSAYWVENWEWEADWQWYDNWVYESYQVWVNSGYYQPYSYTVGGVIYSGSYWVNTSHYETYYNYVNRGYWVDEGEWVDNGWWEFENTFYSASLSATMNITPDSNSPTAFGNNMRSGYGFTQRTTGTVSTSAPSSMYTSCQNAVSYFPEFMYKTYWRLLDRTSTGMTSVFEFKKNPYSTYNSRVHFTPVWFPDSNYKCYTYILDMWTPAGMLSAQKTDDITIYGSVFDDWHYAADSVN